MDTRKIDDKPLYKPKLVGGRLCLDFANTADWHGSDEPVEYLTGYRELVLWSEHAGVIDRKEVDILLEESGRHPVKSAKVLKEALLLREALLRIFTSFYLGEKVSASDLKIFNTAFSGAMSKAQIVLEVEGFGWGWYSTTPCLDRMLWPVLKDAADLLTSELLARVRSCSDTRCGWLFMDTTRNRSRRWCDMKDCGNRAKVKRHYHKLRK